MGKRKRRNKAQRRSKLTSARRFQRRLGQGKVHAKGRDRWFDEGREVDDEIVSLDTAIARVHDRLIPDGHPLSPYRAAS